VDAAHAYKQFKTVRYFAVFLLVNNQLFSQSIKTHLYCICHKQIKGAWWHRQGYILIFTHISKFHACLLLKQLIHITAILLNFNQ